MPIRTELRSIFTIVIRMSWPTWNRSQSFRLSTNMACSSLRLPFLPAPPGSSTLRNSRGTDRSILVDQPGLHLRCQARRFPGYGRPGTLERPCALRDLGGICGTPILEGEGSCCKKAHRDCSFFLQDQCRPTGGTL